MMRRVRTVLRGLFRVYQIIGITGTIISAVVAVTMLVPALRQYVLDSLPGTTAPSPVTTGSTDRATPADAGFPAGCVPLRIKLDDPKAVGSVEVYYAGQVLTSEVMKCNPEAVRRSGKSSLVDVNVREQLAIVKLNEGVAVLGIAADASRAYFEVLRCRPTMVVFADGWQSLRPESVYLVDVTSTLSASAREKRLALCRQPQQR